jgi:ABC-type antimicrobial peptide transport system permease subunit
MAWFGELWRRLATLIRRRQLDTDLEEEMRLHVELRTQQHIQAGVLPEQAGRVARRRFGNVTLLKEVSREMWGWRWLEVLLQDIRYGLRMLAKNPGVTMAVLSSLALGIGANTAIFSLLNAVVLKALPVERPEQLVQFSETYSQGDEASFAATFEIRYFGSLSTVLDGVRRRVWAIDRNFPLFRVKTLEVQTEDSLVKERLIATLSTFFGVLAALLACIGLYGTMAYGVARRTGEIGLRMALGAHRRGVIWMVLRETVLLIVIGILMGLLCAVGVSHLLASQLYGVKPTDVLTLSAASLLLATVAMFAGYVPARRASRVDPMVALRYE